MPVTGFRILCGSVKQQFFMSFSSFYERIGAPQLIALILLLVFALQCVWFIEHEPLSAIGASHRGRSCVSLRDTLAQMPRNEPPWFR